MRVLHLTLKKKWFDMIASGEKKEEYREIKMYWATRLCNGFPQVYGIDRLNPDFKEFDIIRFKNGYGENAPTLDVKCEGMSIGEGKSEWGANGKSYIIKLGRLLASSNHAKEYADAVIIKGKIGVKAMKKWGLKTPEEIKRDFKL